jgi:hypothetical protein
VSELTTALPFPSRTRTTLLAIVAATMLAFVSLISGMHNASAMGVWCSGDPTILVNGNPVSVTLSVPAANISSIDEVTVTFHVPSNSSVVVLNTSFLFPERTVIVRDQPAVSGLLSIRKLPVDVAVKHRGAEFPTGLTVISLDGNHLWIPGDSDHVMHTSVTTLLGASLGSWRLF